jgi:transketolase
LWDDNGISIDGDVVHWFADDTPRFEAYGWNVIRAVDGHDVAPSTTPSRRPRPATSRR